MIYAENIKAGMTIKSAEGDWVAVERVVTNKYEVIIICKDYPTLILSRWEMVEYR